MVDLQERLAGEGKSSLRDAVRAALTEPAASVSSWEIRQVSGGFGALAGASRVYEVSGTADVGGLTRAWRLILKELSPAPREDDARSVFYSRRELLLYGSGVLNSLPPGIRAPRCFGVREWGDGTAWVWLERIEDDPEAWGIERWALAGRHLGQFNGAYLAGRPLPVAEWLSGGTLRSWLKRHEPLVRQIEAAAEDPAVRQWWPKAVVDSILSLWAERESFVATLERLPQTFTHGDAIRRNLLTTRGSDGSRQTVAIDWEFAGYRAAGEEAGQTLSVASAFFHVDPKDLPELDEALFAGYLAGLRDADWAADERQVRFAYAAHAALRNGFNAVGTVRPDEERVEAIKRSQGRTWDELAERRAEIRPFLLKRAEEARRLLDRM